MSTVMVRAFVAFEVSPEMRQQLAVAQTVLKKSTARLTFVDPALIHITVKFLGEVDEKKIPDVAAALRSLRTESFPIKSGRITVNNPTRPHTVWCAIDDAGRGGRFFLQWKQLWHRSVFPTKSGVLPLMPHLPV